MLSLEEWTAAGGKRAGFDALDYNKDNVLTRQEFRSNARKLKAFNDFSAAAPETSGGQGSKAGIIRVLGFSGADA